jgi:transposase
MDKLIERCAGLDVHKKTVVACVRVPGPAGQRHQETRSFATMTDGLLALRDWLCAHQVAVVGMASTGAYWKPVYYRLEDDLECWLLNAHHLRNVPGRTTDLSDAARICQLVEHGLVRPSFVPPRPIRQLRDLTRYRKVVIPERTRAAQRLEKLLEDAGIKLSVVASDILGVSGRAMLAALIAGSCDPTAMAELAKGRLRGKLGELRAALHGHFDRHHGLLAAEMLARIDAAEATIQRLSGEIDRLIAPYAWALRLGAAAAGDHSWGGPTHRRGDRGRDRRRHAPLPKRRPPRLLGGHVPGEQRIGRQAPRRHHPQGFQVAARHPGRGRPRGRPHQRHLPGRPVLAPWWTPQRPTGRGRGWAFHPGQRLPRAGPAPALRRARRRGLPRAPVQPSPRPSARPPA